MSKKHVIIGGAEWGISDENASDVAVQIKTAMESGTVAALELLDRGGRQVTVYLNGKLAESVILDLDLGPRPSEMSD